jgi:hypothetical protein
VSSKSEKSYEKGDMPVVLKVQSTTSVLVKKIVKTSSFPSSSILTISQSFGNSPMNNGQQQLLLLVSLVSKAHMVVSINSSLRMDTMKMTMIL